MEAKLNPKRAKFVLAKIDQILDWERRVNNNRDVHFVELGRYLCEVRAGQYWRVENLSRLTSSWRGVSLARGGRPIT